jgi:hypothetical protein
MGVVGFHPMAVDNSWQYRPQESPAETFVGDIVLLAEASLTTRAFQSRVEPLYSR